MIRYFPRYILILFTLLAVSCNGAGTEGDAQDEAGDAADGVETDAPVDAQQEDVEREEIDWEPFAITGLEPDHGPFTGGTEVLIRGRGFEEGAQVFFGEHMVQQIDTVLIDDNRLGVLSPAGFPGTVDVRVVIGDDEAVGEDAYTYDIFYVDPYSGSVAGGTYVQIEGSGTDFEPGSTITFDGAEAEDVDWISPTRLTCRTPAGVVGPAAVSIDGETNDYEVRDAYLYYNSSDPINGGLGGGPIEGSINVTVLDSYTGAPVPEAFCMLGASGETAFQGLTDERGQITFSEPDMRGPRSVTCSKEEYEATTIREFDARDVTIFLLPIPDPEPGPLPPPAQGAKIRGELVFEHGGEFGPGPWEIVPEPGPNEVKIAYVYATGYGIWYPPPNPGLSGASPIVEEDFDNTGDYGFKFSVFARPETVAVWALAGIQNTVTDTFVPYAFGVARGIVAGPGEEIEGVLVYMVHPLDQSLEVAMEEYFPPLDLSYGPGVYKADLFLDLGGDGVIFRDDRTILKNMVSNFFYPGWLPLRYELADASYTVVVGAYTPAIDELTGQTIYANPFTVKVIDNITHPWETVTAADFIGVPYPVDPSYGSTIANMHMEFGNDGAEPDFWLAMLQTYPDQLPLWRIILSGDQLSYDLPDLAAVADLPAPPSGYTVWIVYGISSPGFVYNEFSYRYLSQTYWSAFSADAFIFEF
jgi:hypothetical protein